MGFDFGAVLVFAIVALAFAFGGIFASRLIGPKFPNPEKASIYECGERPIGVAWFNFNPRFYLVALVFVIFEVEIAFMFPVAMVYRDWVEQGRGVGLVAFVEIFLFVLILAVGLVHVWLKGDLSWVKDVQERKRQAQQKGI